MGKIAHIALTVTPVDNSPLNSELVSDSVRLESKLKQSTVPGWMSKITTAGRGLFTFNGYMNFTIGFINAT